MWEEGLKGVFLSTGLATNGSANYREAAAPCKPAAKAAVGSQATAVPKVYACRELFAFASKMSSFVNSMVPGQNIRQRIGSRSRFFPSCLLFFRPFARIVSILILILAQTDKYRILAQSPVP